MQSNIRHLSSVDRYRALSAPKVNRIRVYTEVSHAALEAARDRHGADPLPPDRDRAALQNPGTGSFPDAPGPRRGPGRRFQGAGGSAGQAILLK